MKTPRKCTQLYTQFAYNFPRPESPPPGATVTLGLPWRAHGLGMDVRGSVKNDSCRLFVLSCWDPARNTQNLTRCGCTFFLDEEKLDAFWRKTSMPKLKALFPGLRGRLVENKSRKWAVSVRFATLKWLFCNISTSFGEDGKLCDFLVNANKINQSFQFFPSLLPTVSNLLRSVCFNIRR